MRIEQLYQEMINKIKEIFINNRVDIFNYFTTSSKENEKIHRDILEILRISLDNIIGTKEFEDLNRKELLKTYKAFQRNPSSEEVKLDYQMSMQKAKHL